MEITRAHLVEATAGREKGKLLYVLDDDNIREDAPYYDLTVLAAKCTARRMVPDYISARVMRELKGDVYPCMGCRSFLTPDRSFVKGNLAKAGNYHEGEHRYYGRFNQGVVTINLVDAALSSGKDMEKFWEILEERLELCHRAGVPLSDEELRERANQWEIRHGGRTPRVAMQLVEQLAGQWAPDQS